MGFNPNNAIVKQCLQGIAMEKMGKLEDSKRLFLQAWNEAVAGFEKFIAAYHVARLQTDIAERIKCYEMAVQIALEMNDVSVKSAFPFLYELIAKCYEEMGDQEHGKQTQELAASFDDRLEDKGPFYHGTKADLRVGDLLVPGGTSNYQDELKMNHIYFTALLNGAGLAAALAKGDGRERVYIVEPTGDFENDPNVTNKYFPGNLTRSYRSEMPLRIMGEVTDWAKLASEEREQWKEKLANNKGEIIN